MAINTIDISSDYAVDLINAHDNIQESAERSNTATNAVAARVSAYVSTLGQPTTTASNFLGTTNGYRIDASKIAGGGVSNADFQKLDSTAPIQPALDIIFDYIHSWIDGDNLVRAIKPVAIADGSINYAEIQAIRDIQDNIQESITGMRSRLDSVASGGGIITVEEIGDKNVSDDELGYLNGAESDIQGQIDTHEMRLGSLGELSSGNVKIDVANIGAGNDNERTRGISVRLRGRHSGEHGRLIQHAFFRKHRGRLRRQIQHDGIHTRFVHCRGQYIRRRDKPPYGYLQFHPIDDYE